MDKKEFYAKCSEIIGVETEYIDRSPSKRFNRQTGKIYTPMTRKSRWGGREPGNGRFPNVGLIRVYGSTVHISLKNPKFSETFNSYEDAISALEEIFSNKSNKLKVGDLIHVILFGEDFGECEIIAYDEEFDCWKVKISKTYPNGYVEISERFYPKN